MPKTYESIIVYLTKGGDARRLLSEGFFHVNKESEYTGMFERRLRPEQCYNYQQVRHKAFQCKDSQRYAKYTKKEHRHDNYREEVIKYVPYEDPHESFSRNCPKLFPTQHK